MIKLKLSFLIFFLFTFFFGFFFTKPVFADSFTVSGHVSDSGGTAIVGATIDVTDANTNANAGSVTTNGSGDYSLVVVGGIYNVKVMPPSGSSFASIIANNQNISNNIIINFVFAPAGSITFSGKVVDSYGNPVPNQLLHLGSSSVSQNVATDVDGKFSFTVQAGNYLFAITNNNSSNNFSQTVPTRYQLSGNISLMQSITSEVIMIPAKKVTVQVKDVFGTALDSIQVAGIYVQNGASVPSVSVASDLPFFSLSESNVNPGPVTDTTGTVTMYLLPSNGSPGSYQFIGNPPGGSIYTKFAATNITITGDQTEIISLQYNHAVPSTAIDLQTQHTDGTYSNPTTVTLSATADTGYTIANTYYKVDGGAQQTYIAPFTVSGSGPHHIEYWSVDNSGVQESHKTKDFTIYVNQAPYVNPIPDAHINLSQSYDATGSFSDPDSTSWTGRVDYDDGAGFENLPLNPDKTFNLHHVYSTPGSHKVTVEVQDDGGATGSTSLKVFVNAAPIIVPPGNKTIQEGDTYADSGTFTDDDSTSWTGTVSYDDGVTWESLPLTSNSFTLNHLYKDNKSNNAPYTVTIKITDDQGATAEQTLQVTVNNANPQVGTITALVNPIQVNQSTTATATFTDVGVLDTHLVTKWNWGDGLESSGNVTEANGSGSVSGDHVYLMPGVYTVTLTVWDKDGGSGQSTFQYLSAYNPTPLGLFSGARIFQSPVGAYAANPSLTGQVQFGVTAKYDNNNQPTGNVSMKFKAANFKFDATGISVLVTAGGKATLMGTGTINGSGNYNFLVTGIDSATDTIRFQITDTANNVIYDSQPGALATDDPTVVVIGQVVIH